MLANALQLTEEDRTRFYREAEKLRAKGHQESQKQAHADTSEYLLRASPTDATNAELFGPPADESSLPVPDHFVGRQEEMRWLLERLRRGGTTSITAVQGIGGIGKTCLASVAIHRLREEGRFTGGVGVNVCQDKTDAILVTREVLSRFEPQRRLPTATKITELHDTARRLLGHKDVLIVLDNVEPGLDVEFIVNLLQGVQATVLLTSRAILPLGETLNLRLLSADQARELFSQYYRESEADTPTDGEIKAIAQIVEHLGRHTLAVKVAARYARMAGRELAVLAEELRTPNDVKSITNAVDLIFKHSFEALPEHSQQLFAAFGAFATAEFSRNAAKALARNLGLSKPDDCVDNLIERALVEPSRLRGLPPGTDIERLRLHPLLQTFAIEQLRKLPSQIDALARGTLAEYYAEYASRPLRVALGPDELNITAALHYAHEHQIDELVAKISLGMQKFWRDFGRASQTEQCVPWGIAAAERIAETNGAQETKLELATLRLAYVHFLRLTGKLGEAEDLAKLVLPVFRDANNLPGMGSTLTALGNIARDRGFYGEARQYLGEALSIFQLEQVQDRSGEGIVLCFLGQISQRLGDQARAERELQQSLATYRIVDDQWGIGLALILLGRVSIQRGLFQEANELYHEALRLHERLEARRSIGADLSSLGEIALSIGDLVEAAKLFSESLAARRSSRDRRGEAVDYTFQGRLAAIQERISDATRFLDEGLAIWEEVQDPRGKGWALSEQAHLALICGKVDEASELLTQSLAIRRQVGDQRGEAVDLRLTAEIALQQGDVVAAEELVQQADSLAARVEDRAEQARIWLVQGKIAEQVGNVDRAELSCRRSLSLAEELGVRREIAQAQEALGSLLIGRRQMDEGCRLLARAAMNYAHVCAPAAERVHEMMVQSGCSHEEPAR
jgi:tetratricopeptide (TPR) repeat protein